MMTAAPVEPTLSFDLSEARSKSDRMNRSQVWFLRILGTLLGAFVLFALFAPSLGRVSAHPGPDSIYLVALLLVLLVGMAFAALLWVVARTKLSPADQIVIRATGVELRASGELVESWGWGEHSSGLRLTDCSQIRGGGTEEYPHYYLNGPHWWNRNNALSSDAFQAVLTAAQERGGQVTEGRGSSMFYSFSVTVFDIRPSGQPP